jgi:uncharacterized membrane protein SpoIIM required for sporulation
LPLLFRKYQKQILYSFIFFVIFFLIGFLSAKYDNTFVRLIMGDDYVNMTNENISKGDPFGVFKSQNEFLMFWMIARNNIQVAVICYLLGIAVSVGTIFSLFKNGIMVGSFQYFFISKGFGIQSLLVIWIHGTLEISAIIIAAAAGIIMGNSILFPKTFSRFESLKKGALDGLKIVLGIVPIIITAAIFESFVTRHTEIPAWLSLLILSGSFIFIVWYVVIYPALITRKLKTIDINE